MELGMGKPLQKKANLPGLRFHDMRHTFITDGAEAGVPVQVMQALVGHMSPEMTRHYTHIRDRAKQKAVKAVESLHPRLLALLGVTPEIGADN
jgi:integrase